MRLSLKDNSSKCAAKCFSDVDFFCVIIALQKYIFKNEFIKKRNHHIKSNILNCIDMGNFGAWSIICYNQSHSTLMIFLIYPYRNLREYIDNQKNIESDIHYMLNVIQLRKCF